MFVGFGIKYYIMDMICLWFEVKPIRPEGLAYLVFGSLPSLSVVHNGSTLRGSKAPEFHGCDGKSYLWQGQKDSNLKPLVLETTALPIELCP